MLVPVVGSWRRIICRSWHDLSALDCRGGHVGVRVVTILLTVSASLLAFAPGVVWLRRSIGLLRFLLFGCLPGS